MYFVCTLGCMGSSQNMVSDSALVNFYKIKKKYATDFVDFCSYVWGKLFQVRIDFVLGIATLYPHILEDL